jgi:lysine 6-dehydrogenase
VTENPSSRPPDARGPQNPSSRPPAARGPQTTSSRPPAARELRTGILGAGGIIAPAIVRDLAESEEAESLLLLDIDGDRAQGVADVHGGEKASARQADALDGLAEVLGDVDVLVNAASYRVNLAAMRACLDAGCHYIDLGGLYHVTAEQLEQSPAFEEAGLLALLGMGSSPGKTNVMAARAVAELADATPKAIDVFAAGRDIEPPAGPSYPYSPRTLVDELTLAPVALKGGEPTELEPLQDGGKFAFPDPIGPSDTIYTLHSEVLTFGESFGCEECSFRLSLAPPVLERVRELVGAGDDAIDAAAREAVPSSAQTVSAHVVSARVKGAEVVVEAVTRPMPQWGLGGGIVSTAAPAAAAVRLLARGQIEERGALPPERCVRPEDLFPELERRGCRFRGEVKASE